MAERRRIILLYKKKDPRDLRNYRPIALLNVDYKILSKSLCFRLKDVIDVIISSNQKGFVPKCLIFENTHLTTLIEAYLDENNEDGIILFCDVEKAFDSCSWDLGLHARSL